MKIKKIGLVSRLDHEGALEMTKSIIDEFSSVVEIAVSPNTAKEIGIEDDVIRIEAIEDMRNTGVEFLIVVGGDGTVLLTLSRMYDPIPILGINMGKVGFLVDTEPEEALSTIEKALHGFTYNEQIRLGVKLNGDILPPATNEIVLMTGRPAKILTTKVKIDDYELEELRSDGIVFSTPTGSTAYAMSAGGPIIDPRVNAALIVPLAPFKLSSRPLVVPADCVINVETTIPEKEAILVIDGQHTYKIHENHVVTLTKADQPARFVKSSIYRFYDKIQYKLC
ncbi:ATP-NAD/AcoX kinase [Methanohalobium evestigatum Z-7303]|uniref:NAD kinase n=1 Tax=Methanohalobium evestigatum (strain ATCC BAA-1072 / DSM 3721 / NBRC 107634 / OCM 161 / Z-7303) TaxID=644295 RepID=D7E810_METEZ|nr:NAD(+)/NADH kinase [Methanohalobium evestigatum]ADI73352.1 ATP-NAD/AcoX kinase [Methanohalobium evestigatum Z-7303]